MPEPSPDDIARLRRARESARKLWKRNYSLQHIEAWLLKEGYDAGTTHLTMHHMFDEFLERLEKNARGLFYSGVGLVLLGLVIFVVMKFQGPLPIVEEPHWYMLTFGVLVIARGFWLRERVRATRASAHRWKHETPDEEGIA